MNIENLTIRSDFGKLCEIQGYTVGLEIGVAYGENAEKILEHFTGHLHLVDPWTEQPKAVWPDGSCIGNPEHCFVYCHGKLSRFKPRYTVHRMMSDEAVSKFDNGSLDFVYLDGNHSRPQVDRDLENWWPKIKAGGIFGGHDYHNIMNDALWSEVEDAVNEFVKKHNLKLHITEPTEIDKVKSWWIQK
jgi:hypothetical protein